MRGQVAVAAAGASEVDNKPGCPISWKCNKPAGVRELLGLGPPYYFNIVPRSEARSIWPPFLDHLFSLLSPLFFVRHDTTRAIFKHALLVGAFVSRADRVLTGACNPMVRPDPRLQAGATKYDVEWAQLEDPLGFKAEWGPTTTERRSPCFNQTQDGGECILDLDLVLTIFSPTCLGAPPAHARHMTRLAMVSIFVVC